MVSLSTELYNFTADLGKQFTIFLRRLDILTALSDVNSCVSVSSVTTVMDITPRGVVLPQIITLSVEGHDVKVNKLGVQGSCIVDIAVHNA